jgi:hypothetical protein
VSFPDLSFIEVARALEVEAVDGGRSLSEFSFDPGVTTDPEEEAVLGRPVDDMDEIEERSRALQEYLAYARLAFEQRGLVYPFDLSSGGDSLDVVPGQKSTAAQVAHLSRIVSQGLPVAKEFEKRAFQALQGLVGGWGVCVGAPRDDRHGPEKGIRRFREYLEPWEVGPNWPAAFPPSGDNGADGFIILGRGWGGPIVFFQSKNTSFSLKSFPEEFGRVPEILDDWFGKRLNQRRSLVPVFGLNTVLTVELKERIAEARGPALAGHIVDAVDILGVETGSVDHPLRMSGCTIL